MLIVYIKIIFNNSRLILLNNLINRFRYEIRIDIFSVRSLYVFLYLNGFYCFFDLFDNIL